MEGVHCVGCLIEMMKYCITLMSLGKYIISTLQLKCVI